MAKGRFPQTARASSPLECSQTSTTLDPLQNIRSPIRRNIRFINHERSFNR
jgi:hypothetical protein